MHKKEGKNRNIYISDKLLNIWEEEEAAEGQVPCETQCCLWPAWSGHLWGGEEKYFAAFVLEEKLEKSYHYNLQWSALKKIQRYLLHLVILNEDRCDCESNEGCLNQLKMLW